MLDINGRELVEHGLAMLLCEIVAIAEEGIHVRVMNSDVELLIGVKQDEVLGGLVADSELTAFEEFPQKPPQNRENGDLEAGHPFE